MTLRPKILLISICPILIITLTLTFGGWLRLKQASEANNAAAADKAARVAETSLDGIRERLTAYATLIQRRADIVQALASGDQDTLDRLIVDAFTRLRAADPTLSTLEVTNGEGIVVIRGHRPDRRGDDKSAVEMVIGALAGQPGSGLVVSITSGEMAFDTMVPLALDGGDIVGTLKLGSYLRQPTAEYLADVAGAEVLFFSNGTLSATTVPGLSEGQQLAPTVLDRARAGDIVSTVSDYGGTAYNAAYIPVAGVDGLIAAVVATLVPRTDLEDQLRNSLFTSLIIVAVTLILLVPAVIVFVRSITRPVGRLVTVMSQIQAGDYAVTIEGGNRSDEIGTMASAVETFREGLKHTQELERQKVEQDKRAAELRKDEMASVANDFEAHINLLAQQVEAAAVKMMSTAQAMAAVAEETQRQANAANRAAGNASSNVATVATASVELASSISEISRQVEHASAISKHAVTAAEGSSAIMTELSTAAGEIGEVVKLINGIAEQTNLLALNATIEAARAGDAGKGFAVVAGEVKTLANQTGQATDQISGQIKSVQDATQRAVDAIKTTVQTITEISDVNSAIASSVEQQQMATDEIAQNVEAAANGTSEVASNIEGVDEAAGDAGRAAEEVLSQGEELTETSQGLNREVASFLERMRQG